jgi:hypothetical protein
VIATEGHRQLQMVLNLAKAEAWLLFRSLLVLAGLVAGGLVIWLVIHPVEPVWWNASWEIGYGQVVLGMTVLIAAQLAAGRPRRDAMADLYASFPATSATRTVAHLAGLLGAVPASLLLIGGTAVAVETLTPIGAPNIGALAAGLLLVIAAGAAGIAIGTRFPHPLAGVLAALVLFVPFQQSNNLSGPTIWLYPWVKPGQLGSLPGPPAGYPPAWAHAAELAGLAVLAGVAALAVTMRSARVPRTLGLLASAGILAVAAICLAGAAQLRPIPAAELNHLVAESADPATAQHCTTTTVTAGQVRYCLYPGFSPELPAIQAPVSAVLAHLPARLAQPLTVRQAAPLYPDPTLTHGHPAQQVTQWDAQIQNAPGYNDDAPASAVYLTAGSWPAGAQLAQARFGLALVAAEWAVHLPPATTAAANGMQCVPLDQAREAIAIWLATQATHPSAAELTSGLSGPGGGHTGVMVRGTIIFTWNFPGAGLNALASVGTQTTEAGYLLASAMSRLPEAKVSHVLRTAWPQWVNWHTTDAQLAAALGIPMPAVPKPVLPGPGTATVPAPGPQPQNPVCTT